MKRANNLYHKIAEMENLRIAFWKAQRSKSGKADVREFRADLDHQIKSLWRVPGYIRYMDDFILFADEKETLQVLSGQVAEFLGEKLNLSLNPIVLNQTRHGIGFLSYKVCRTKLRLSLKAKRRFTRKISLANKIESADHALPLLAFVCRADSVGFRRKVLYGVHPDGSNRVNRGGAWNNNANNCRSANRNNNTPSNSNNNIGFRTALIPAQGKDGCPLIEPGSTPAPVPTQTLDKMINPRSASSRRANAERGVKKQPNSRFDRITGFTGLHSRTATQCRGYRSRHPRLGKQLPIGSWQREKISSRKQVCRAILFLPATTRKASLPKPSSSVATQMFTLCLFVFFDSFTSFMSPLRGCPSGQSTSLVSLADVVAKKGCRLFSVFLRSSVVSVLNGCSALNPAILSKKAVVSAASSVIICVNLWQSVAKNDCLGSPILNS